MSGIPDPTTQDKKALEEEREQPDEHWSITDPPIPSSSEMYYQIGYVRVFHRAQSPWLEIETPNGAIAVWARTGAVHPVTKSGAVADEPLELPFPNDNPGRALYEELTGPKFRPDSEKEING